MTDLVHRDYPAWAYTPDLTDTPHLGAALSGVSTDEYLRLKVLGLSRRYNEMSREIARLNERAKATDGMGQDIPA